MINVRAAAVAVAFLSMGAWAAQSVNAVDETPAAVIALSSNCLMGGAVGGRWVKGAEMAEMLRGGERYSVYGLDSKLGSAIALQYHPTDLEDGNVERYRITGVLDVDGDGKMEIVVHGRHYEGDWTTVYASAGEKLNELASCGCSL